MPAISNVNELQDMNLDLAGDYWLANDIDATITATWNGGLGFDPIMLTVEAPPGVFTMTPFTGTFNGNGHTINNLTIARQTLDNPFDDAIGLFGYIGNGAVIQDVNLTNVSIAGRRWVGGLIGLDNGVGPSTVFGCSVTGVVNANNDYTGGLIGSEAACDFDDCHADVAVTQTGGNDSCGGFVGEYTGANTVNECSAEGDVVSDGDQVGGFAGIFDDDATISESYATGNVTGAVGGDSNGGFAGGLTGAVLVIRDCYARGDVTNGDEYVAGFCGLFGGASMDDCYSTGLVTPDGGAVSVGGFNGLNFGVGLISNCFWDIQTSNQAISDGGTGQTTVQMKVLATFTAAGWDFTNIWFISAGINDGYPAFRWIGAPPTVTTLPATAISHASATLNGTLDADGGEACDCGFEWGLTLAYGNTTPTDSKNTGETFSQAIIGLTPNTTYHFRSVATNSIGTSYGADRTFTTLEPLLINKAFALAREEL